MIDIAADGPMYPPPRSSIDGTHSSQYGPIAGNVISFVRWLLAMKSIFSMGAYHIWGLAPNGSMGPSL